MSGQNKTLNTTVTHPPKERKKGERRGDVCLSTSSVIQEGAGGQINQLSRSDIYTQILLLSFFLTLPFLSLSLSVYMDDDDALTYSA